MQISEDTEVTQASPLLSPRSSLSTGSQREYAQFGELMAEEGDHLFHRVIFPRGENLHLVPLKALGRINTRMLKKALVFAPKIICPKKQ